MGSALGDDRRVTRQTTRSPVSGRQGVREAMAGSEGRRPTGCGCWTLDGEGGGIERDRGMEFV